jgi:phosphoribosyl 1,2-cyclic phosphodiesterase
LQFYHLTPDSELKLDDVTIRTALINQNQRSIGYRVTWQEYSVAYVTDLNMSAEQGEREQVLQIIQDVDLLIANATYTPPTSHDHESAELLWQAAVEMAQKAGVRKLIISHHHPDDHDDFLDQVEKEVQSTFSNALLACEGLALPVF